MSYGPVLSLWAAMTAVMMLPVVAPWLRAVHRIERTGRWATGTTHSGSRTGSLTVTGGFALGYGGAWAGFSAVAAALQVALGALGFAAPLRDLGGIQAGVPLMLVGAYQFTGIKDRCLSKCRSPMGYLLSHWHPGGRGGLRMGFGHGLHCLGCCWALMLLALVVGHMHLIWMAVLTALMITETGMPGGRRAVRPVGAALVLVGLVFVLG